MKAFNEKVILRNVAIDPQGGGKDLIAAINTPVTVFLTGTATLASLFDLDEAPIANPVNTDIKGNVVFKVADGVYDIVGANGTDNETRWDQYEIFDLSIPLDVDNIKHYTLSEAIALTTAVIGQIVQITDRADGQFEYVLASGVTPNTFNIVQCTGAISTLALVLRITYPISANKFGAVADYDTTKTDNTGAIQAAIDYPGPVLSSVKIDDGIYAHTGLTMQDGTAFKGMGIMQTKLVNTHATNDSLTIPYNNDGNFYTYVDISGLWLDAENIRVAGQAGLRLETCRHCVIDEMQISNHGYGVREQSSWSNDLSNIHIISNTQGWWVESGVSTGGTPNYRSNINLDSNRYGLLMGTQGNSSYIWVGGSIEGTEEEAIEIVGNVNRAITFQSVNFETNNVLLGDYQIILGDDADALSGPSNVSFKGCRFAHVGANREFVFDINRGTGIAIDECNFLGYDKVADISNNVGTLSFRELTGISIFADTTDVSTSIPATGQGTGNKRSIAHINSVGTITVYQDSSDNNILESRRNTESNRRFEIGATGKIGWHNFNAASPDVTLMRKGVGIVGVDDSQSLKTGSGVSGTRPTVTVSGSMFFDTTLGKPIWSNGVNWVDATGAVV